MSTVIEFYDKDAIKNILAVISLKPDKVVYLYDKEIRDMNYFVSLEKCFHKYMPMLMLEKFPVDINRLEDVYSVALSVIDENRDCIMEFTGGSELMMIGGFKAGNERGIKMVYTDILKGQIVDILDGSRVVRTAQITIDDFVDAKGACFVGNSHREPEPEQYEPILRMCYYLFEHLREWKFTCGFLQTAASNYPMEDLCLKSRIVLVQKDGRRVYPDKNVLHAFLKFGFIEDLNYTNENLRFRFASVEAKQYMINYGVWLELFVFINAKKTEAFDDVRLGAMIDWNAYDGINIAENEIDVILTDNSMPVFISCKLREVDTAALNELLIERKRLGGWFSKCIIVGFGNDKSKKSGAYKRALDLGIILLDKSDIMSRNFGERLVGVVKGHDLVSLKWRNV